MFPTFCMSQGLAPSPMFPTFCISQGLAPVQASYLLYVPRVGSCAGLRIEDELVGEECIGSIQSSLKYKELLQEF